MLIELWLCSGIVVIHQRLETALLITLEIVPGRFLIKEKNLRYLSRRPSLRQSNDRFDAICLTFITQRTMESFKFSYFFF